MSKLQPIWQDLPIHFKYELIHYLDFRSRFNLRSCSKSDQKLIDASPFFLHSVYIEQEKNAGFNLKITENRFEPTYKRSCMDEEFENATSIIYQVLSHPKTTVDNFATYCESDFSLDEFLSKFLEIMEGKLLNCHNFSWEAGNSDENVIVRLLKTMNPDRLRGISINFIDVENKEAVIEELVETEQWKRAKKIFLNDFECDEIFEKLLHVENLKINVNKFTEAMLLNLIEKVKTRDPPVGSQFVINSSEIIELDTLVPAFQSFPEVHNILKGYQSPERAILLTNDVRCLAIVKWDKAIEATVCRIERFEEDFKNSHGRYVTLDMI